MTSRESSKRVAPEGVEAPESAAPRVPAVILAAGGSARLGQPKQLLRIAGLGEEVLVDRAVRLAREAGASPIVVVLGAYAVEVERAAKLSECTVILNAEWREGLASSLRIGIRAVSEIFPLVQAALVLVCDQPALSTEHLQSLLAGHRATPDQVIASQYAGRRGIPVVLPRHMFPTISELTGDQGARAILEQAARLRTIPFAGGERDLDSPEDLRFWTNAT